MTISAVVDFGSVLARLCFHFVRNRFTVAWPAGCAILCMPCALFRGRSDADDIQQPGWQIGHLAEEGCRDHPIRIPTQSAEVHVFARDFIFACACSRQPAVLSSNHARRQAG